MDENVRPGICRLCLAFTKTIFSLVDDVELSTMLEALTSLKIFPNDSISTIMCLKCCLNLKLAYTIQQKMLSAEERFHKHQFPFQMKEECDDYQNMEIDLDEQQFPVPVKDCKMIEQEEKDFTCDVCGKKKYSQTSLRKHKYDVHVEIDCLICGKKLRQAAYRRHVRRHKQRAETECDPMEEFDNTQNESEVDIKEHKILEKTEVDVETSGDTRPQNSRLGIEQEKENFTCDICGKEKYSRTSLRKHKYDVHVEMECPICDKKLRQANYKRHMQRHGQSQQKPGIDCDEGEEHTDNVQKESKIDIKEEILKKNEEIDKLQEGIDDYPCDVCGKKTYSSITLKRHKSNAHIIMECSICKRKLSRVSFKRHVELHNAKNLNEFSGKMKPSTTLLKCRKKRPHKIVECPICSKRVANGSLKRHIDRHNTAKEQTESKTHTCDICGKSKISKSQLQQHMSGVHVVVECPICQKKITQTNLKRHVERHSEPNVVCELCGVSCKQQDMRSHMYYTHSKESHKCSFCDKVYKSKYKKLVHEKKHLGKPDFVCDTCGKKFYEARHLKKHIESTHEKLRPHICEFCKVGFSTRCALRTHRRQHTKETPYKCEFCGEGFKQKVSLRSHLRSQHNVREELICECKVCGKKFGSDMALLTHSRVHD